MTATEVPSIMREARMHATPRPPRGPGDDDGDEELPIGDPPDDDETDDPNDEDEGEEDDEPLHGGRAVRAGHG
jgi:hypothetical protein